MNLSNSIDVARRELQYALRTVRKNSAFSTLAVLCLALGIAVTTTMFTVVNAVLLRAVPFREPERLVRLVQHPSAGDVTIAEFEHVKDRARSFSGIAAYRGGGERRLDAGAVQRWVSVLAVSADFLRTLGIQLGMGREFGVHETTAGGPQAIVISENIWRATLGADPGVLGRVVTLNTTPYTIVGVLPAGFWFPQPIDALVPLQPAGTLTDLGTNTQLIARLRDGIALAGAQAEVTSFTDDLRRLLGGSVSRSYRGLAAVSYQDWLVASVRTNLLLLFAATGLVLLISCANVAMLLLARTAARAREIAVRVALGGDRRLLPQFLTENLLLAALGTAIGVVGAYGLVRGFVAWVPFQLPTAKAIELDESVLAFTASVAVGTAVVFTLVPLFIARRLDVQTALRSDGRQAGAQTILARTRSLLVIGEVALSATLLVVSSLLMQSLYRLGQERLGFSPDGLVTFETPFAPERARNPTERLNFTNALLERLERMPGVRSAAATTVLPLTGQSNLPAEHDGHADHSIGGMEVRPITPGYFETMGIPLRRGRSFVEMDASLPLVIVNETVARSWWPSGEPLGDRLTIGRFRGKELFKDVSREVIGVVGDTKTVTVQAPPRPMVYTPMTGTFGGSSLAWVVRVNGASDFAARVRTAVDGVDPGQRIVRLRTMNDVVARTSATSRFNARLFGGFSVMALVLAALGVYGVLSFLVEQRRQEIGTRMALGAPRSAVLASFLRQGLTLTFIGLAIGCGGALLASRWLSSLLFGVSATDASSFAAASVLLLGVAVAASYIPARRAARTDPMVAMRSE